MADPQRWIKPQYIDVRSRRLAAWMMRHPRSLYLLGPLSRVGVFRRG